ncbi:HindIII family type II restriction endonuclease [Candidatus Poribacteria bacterium]|nr:HindIII family type II restriction endonuclease [Candidatus Poribacteria bacterium]
MVRLDVIDLIFKIAGLENAFDILEEKLAGITKDELSSSLLECGIIPELLEHDSSEEKLWAKYCDLLLAQTWTHLSIPSEVIRTRGDSADVFGRTQNYSIVGDAKAFRLSRTAKNQKDFKVQALNDWRKSNTYACLASSLYQYPQRASQIYEQAIERNVTLLSYTHLKFLLDCTEGQNLDPLWRIGSELPKSKNAQQYWEAIDETTRKIAGESEKTLNSYKQETIDKIKQLGKEGIDYWQTRITAYKELSQEEAVARLIKAEKVEAKIGTIKKAIDIVQS